MEPGPLDELFRPEEELPQRRRSGTQERLLRDPLFGDPCELYGQPAPREHYREFRDPLFNAGSTASGRSGCSRPPGGEAGGRGRERPAPGEPHSWPSRYEERRRRDPIFGDLDVEPPPPGDADPAPRRVRGRSPYRRSPLTRSPSHSRSSQGRRRRRQRKGGRRRRRQRSEGGRQPQPQQGRRGSAMVWGQHHMTIENVPYDMVGLELKELAKNYTWSKTMTFARTYRRGPVCYGMLEFTDGGDMRKAIKDLEGKMIEGSTDKMRCYEGNNYHEVWRPEEHLKR